MLDTNICSYIIRKKPVSVHRQLNQHLHRKDRIVISAITYAELLFGATGKKASPHHMPMVKAFCTCLDAILPWGQHAVEATTALRMDLAARGTPISQNDASIAGHALAEGAVVVTNNLREFQRVAGLVIEDWTTNDH